jgi:peptide/nickel transport system substrate-binding protein
MQSNGLGVVFGFRPNDKSPFRDERLRQAFSMTWDRDQYIDVMFNVKGFTDNGIPVRTSWSTSVQNNYFAAWYLNPQGKDFGPNAKYFKRDIAEAKKLMAAAGYANGFETISTIIQGNEYGTSYPTQVEIIEGMVGEIGIKHKKNVVDYTKVFQFQYRDVFGAFEGLSYKLGPQASAPEPTGQLVYDYHSKASTGWYGFDASGKGDNAAGDPAVDALLDKATAEFDPAKRKEIVYEIQKYLGKPQYGIRWPGGATGFLLAWPALQNFNVWQNDPRRESVREWIDDTKAPIKKA